MVRSKTINKVLIDFDNDIKEKFKNMNFIITDLNSTNVLRR